MKIKKGDLINDLSLPSIDGTHFKIQEHKGKKIFLTFYRFAACPFCNLRINEIIKRYDEFGDNFLMVAVFDSPLENLIKHAKKHNAPFPILADENYKYYKKYGLERSFFKFLRAVIFKFPTLIKASIKGFIPIVFKGYVSTLPSDIMINSNGIVEDVYYAKTDTGDHLPFNKIKSFSAKN
tara:strand:+ start:50632 stop:51171 length:540 start_codon:yes stop_codon:yes gene_type:complete